MSCPTILGILNITADSFSDGGAYLNPAAALDHAHELRQDGADIIDIGSVASNVDSVPVSVEEEIARLAPVVAALRAEGVAVSIDTFRAETQRWAMSQSVAYLNDIHGFPDPSIYPDLAASECKLIVMHSAHGTAHITREQIVGERIKAAIDRFFAARLAALEQAGIARGRMILDPGMGFFLGPDPTLSFDAIRHTGALKARFGCPVLISVSRKSFLRRVTGRADAKRAGAATLAAELFAATQGADFIRTHDPAALSDGLKIWAAAAV